MRVYFQFGLVCDMSHYINYKTINYKNIYSIYFHVNKNIVGVIFHVFVYASDLVNRPNLSGVNPGGPHQVLEILAIR